MKPNDALELLRQREKLGEIKSIVAVITSAMVLPLYFLFWICDLIYAPALKWEFLALRATVIPLALVINYFIIRANTLITAYRVAFSYTAFIGLPISLMVFLLADPATPYYAGLNLVAIGTLTFIPWTPLLFVLAAMSIFAPYYIIAIAMSHSPADYHSLIVSTFFIVSTVAISWVVRMFYERMRVRELKQRLDLNEEIERRKQMEIAVIHARDDAIAANESKSAFLATMSHELRTPLNAVIGYSELLQEVATEDGMETYVDDLKKIEGGGKHLLNMINNVLDISKVEAGHMELHIENVAIVDVLKNITTIAQPLADKNHNELRIEAQTLGSINTDQTKLQQILLNLISNACKFTQDGQVSVLLKELCVNSQQWLSIEVADTGIGMTPEQCNKIFRAFVQAESGTTKQYGGTGLGLAISQQFCRLMGGDITVSSVPGRGTVFSVMLPRDLAQRNASAGGIRQFRERRASNSKIAVLYSELDCRNAIQVALIQHGFEATTVGTDAAGVEFVKGLSPDVVIYNCAEGPEIARLWTSGDNENDMFARPTVLVGMLPQYRHGFAFALHQLINVSVLPQLIEKDLLFLKTEMSSGNILLVGEADDVIGNMLEVRRWSVDVVSDARSASQRLREVPYDPVIISMTMLRQTDGDQLLTLMQQLNQSDARIILLTDESSREQNAASLFEWVNMGMKSIALDEQTLSNLIISLVLKCLRR